MTTPWVTSRHLLRLGLPLLALMLESRPNDVPAQATEAPLAKPITQGASPPPERTTPGPTADPVTAAPPETPLDTPKVIRQPLPGEAPAAPLETTETPYVVEIAEAQQPGSEASELDDSLPDFELLLPSLRERLCLTLDGQTPLPIDWNTTQVKLTPASLNTLRAGTLTSAPPADTSGDPLQPKKSSPRCVTSAPEGKRSTYFEVVSQPRLPAPADTPQTLRVEVRLNRLLHRASVLEKLDGKTAPASTSQTFTWQASNGLSSNTVSTAPEANLIQGSPLSYSLAPQDHPNYTDVKDALKIEPGKGKPCADTSTPSGCFQAEVIRTLKTHPITLDARESKRSCAFKPLPKKVWIHVPKAQDLWPKGRALEVNLAKKEDVPTSWYPLSASLLKADAESWTLEPWTLASAEPISPLVITARLEQTPLPVLWTGVDALNAGSFTLALADLCGKPVSQKLTPGDGQLNLPLPKELDIKKFNAWLKKQKYAPDVVITPPRGLRLKGCSSVSPTCTTSLDDVLDDKGLTLELESAPAVRLLYVFLSKHLTDPEALYNLLKARLETLRKDEPEATVRLVVTDGRTLSVATGDPKALDNVLQNVLEWTPRGIAPQSLERLDQALAGLGDIRKDWLDLKLELYIARALWEDIGRETEWIQKIVETHQLETAQAGILDLIPGSKPPRPYAQVLKLKPLTQP